MSFIETIKHKQETWLAYLRFIIKVFEEEVEANIRKLLSISQGFCKIIEQDYDNKFSF